MKKCRQRDLFDFLLYVIKEGAVKELLQGYVHPIAELLEGNHTGVLAFGIEDAVYGGRGHTGLVGERVDGDPLSGTQLQYACGNGFLGGHGGLLSLFFFYFTRIWDKSCGIYRKKENFVV
jgi:hypothetical protein